MYQVEEWRDIDGYDGRYQVSNLGNIRTLDYNHTHTIKLLKTSTNHRGYHQVCLTKNNKKKIIYIHRLVALAFVQNPSPEIFNYVNHIDEDKNNNNANNLEWCTNGYNVRYGSRTFKTSKEHAQYDLSGNFIRIWSSGKEIERVLGLDRRQIGRCCDGLIPSAYGYIWRKATERGRHLNIK